MPALALAAAIVARKLPAPLSLVLSTVKAKERDSMAPISVPAPPKALEMLGSSNVREELAATGVVISRHRGGAAAGPFLGEGSTDAGKLADNCPFGGVQRGVAENAPVVGDGPASEASRVAAQCAVDDDQGCGTGT